MGSTVAGVREEARVGSGAVRRITGLAPQWHTFHPKKQVQLATNRPGSSRSEFRVGHKQKGSSMRASAWRPLAAIVLCFAIVPESHALFRAYLSPTGSDANPCTLTAPCRLMPAALAAADDGGEIWLLGSANYNTVTVNITKSVTIQAVPGVGGSIVATGGPAISIATPGLQVTLRNLAIVPVPGAGPTDGVSMTAASVLNVDNTTIGGLVNGVVASAGVAVVTNSSLSGNVLWGAQATGAGQVTISGSRLAFNGQGGLLVAAGGDSTATGTLSDSVVMGGSSGALAFANTANALSRLSVTRSTIDSTTNGVGAATDVAGTAVTFVGSSTIANSGVAMTQSGAGSALISYGNNQIPASGAPTGTITSSPTI